MDGRRWVSPRGCASGVDGPNKHYGRRATTDRTCVYSRIGSGACVENKALMVLAGGRGPHDQPEDAALHGGSYGREGPVAPCGPHSDVRRAEPCDRGDVARGARNPVWQGQPMKGGHFFPEENPDEPFCLREQSPICWCCTFRKGPAQMPDLKEVRK